MRVFWPRNGLRRVSGDVVGWRLQDTLCVVAIVEKWTEDLDQHDHPSRDETSTPSGVSPLSVLGSACPSPSASQADATEDDQAAGLRFWVDDRYLPIASSLAAEIVLFDPPDPRRLRFFTLRSTGPSRSAPAPRQSLQSEMAKQDRYSSKRGSGELDEVIDCLNCIHDLQVKLENANDMGRPWKTALLAPTATLVSLCGTALLPLQLLATGVIKTLSASSFLGVEYPPARSISCSASQICLRLEQLLSSPYLFRLTQAAGSNSMADRSRHYMHFWNTVWLILNDLILGYAARQLILQAPFGALNIIPPWFEQHGVRDVARTLAWLNDWPVGLKLNTPLSQFFCSAFTHIADGWGALILPIFATAFPYIVAASAVAAGGGSTLLLCLISDLLALVTLHLHLCHALASRICLWQLDSLSGLWNLFRGKRWNALRGRTDSYAYDVDQLFLGTLLFTVSAFLLPTVLTYAGLFYVIHLGMAAIQWTLSLAVNALNAFPLFELLLRLKEPSRLPSGVTFHLGQSSRNSPSGGACTGTYLELRNAPRGLWSILSHRDDLRS